MQISAVYTFGSPRVLSPEAAVYAEESLLVGKVFRHVRGGDAVTVVPAKRRGGEDEREVFDHVGLVAFIDDDGEMRFDAEAWRQARERLREIRDDLGRAGQEHVEAHQMARYHTPVYEQVRRDPSPRVNGWHPAVALHCARALRLAYESPGRPMARMLGFKDAVHVDVGAGVDALVVVPPPIGEAAYGIVAFRGTRSGGLGDLSGWRATVSDWRRHLEAEQEPWHFDAPGTTHGAWLRELAELERPLAEAVELICGDVPLVVTGHGKGAAQATQWALRRAQDEENERLIGEPLTPLEELEQSLADPTRALPWTPSGEEQELWRPPLSYSRMGARIRQLRDCGGLSQAGLALRVGVEQSHVSRLEKGEYRIQLELLLKILAVFDVSIGEFFDASRESLTPGNMRLLEDVKKLSEEDREAVRNLIRFKYSELERQRKLARRRLPPD